MGSLGVVNLLVEKFSSMSSKMVDLSFGPNSRLHLLNSSPGFYKLDSCEVSNDSMESYILPFNFDYDETVSSSDAHLSFDKNFVKNFTNSSCPSFSPHLFSVVNDSIRYKQSSKFLSAAHLTNIMCDLPILNPSVMDPIYSNLKTLPKTFDPILIDKNINQPSFKMSVTLQSAKMCDKKAPACDKPSVPSCVTLNLELANRKTKELQKRSKKRRRRQKKGQNQGSSSSKSSQKSLPRSPEKDSQFCVTVKQQMSSPSCISQFVISVAGLSDDDSDWESLGGSNILAECPEYEFAGLFVANISPRDSHHNPSRTIDVECSFTSYTKQELEEIQKLQAVLLEVNRNWSELTKDDGVEPKHPTKVSFVSDDKLVQVLPADVCDRKGEWEQYACERLRFKRRIEELEAIISPCLTENHRSKIYEKFILNAL